MSYLVAGIGCGSVDWVAFDLETTGLPRHSRPVEIGARRYNADGTVWDFCTFVNPGVSIPDDVIRVHGITDAMVADAPDVGTAIERFLEFSHGAAFVAHNAAFDAGILAFHASRLAMPVPAAPVHDSVRLARRLLPGLWSYRLANLARTFKIAQEGFHRALPDAIVVGRLMQRLLEMHPTDLVGFPDISAGRLGTLLDFVPAEHATGQVRVSSSRFATVP